MTQQMGGVKASFDVEESWLPTRARWARSPIKSGRRTLDDRPVPLVKNGAETTSK